MKKRIKTSRLNINVLPTTKAQLAYMAGKSGLTMTEYVELLVDTYQTLHSRNAVLMRLLERLEADSLALPQDIITRVEATRRAIRIIDTGPTHSAQSQS